jgi:sulfotransferase
MKKFHMIAGLPRSGSTLLASILNQNPRFTAGISDPLNDLIINAVRAFSIADLSTQCTEAQRVRVLRSLINSYYEDAEIAFNTSRFWTSNLPLMHKLFPEAKIICCVREIGWILDSFERLYNKNSTVYSRYMYGAISQNVHSDVFIRSKDFLDHENSMMRAYNSLKTAFYGEHTDKLYFVEYNDLATNTENVMQSIYEFIDEPYFEHDFQNVEMFYDDYDKSAQMNNMHSVRKVVAPDIRNTIIPPEIWETLKGMEFWRT